LSEHVTYVVDSFDNGVVAIPLDEARRLAALNDALETSATWGEFLTSVAGDVETWTYLNGCYDDEAPLGEETFDPDELPGFADGYWPTWPKQAMLDWLPQQVTKLGVVKTGAFGQSFLAPRRTPPSRRDRSTPGRGHRLPPGH
jgi:hypothetical protein